VFPDNAYRYFSESFKCWKLREFLYLKMKMSVI
jgi:hypothetical protein